MLEVIVSGFRVDKSLAECGDLFSEDLWNPLETGQEDKLELEKLFRSRGGEFLWLDNFAPDSVDVFEDGVLDSLLVFRFIIVSENED